MVELDFYILNQFLEYNPETGKLFWKYVDSSWFVNQGVHKAWVSRFSGKEAFTSNIEGYRRGKILGQNLRAHRVIWCMVTGSWPEYMIDHIDGNPENNKWENLRSVSPKDNSKNSKTRLDNSSGTTGVYFNKTNNKWIVQITDISGKRHYKGSYLDLDKAIEIRKYWEGVYNYHKNHGRN